MMSPAEARIDYDVAIIGAGISGINAGYYLETQAPAGISYAILEARSDLGGTWDLFRYPGIRSDSDVYSFGFSWNPWPGCETLASGAAIRGYLYESAQKHGIDKKIRYNHKIISATWSCSDSVWALAVETSNNGATEPVLLRCRFIILGTGYYDYEEPRTAHIPGIEAFPGRVIHPQFWPEKADLADKDVVIIGSGATAVTLLPALLAAPGNTPKRVTMLQRSPGYISSLPSRSFRTRALRATLPAAIAGPLNRLLYALIGLLLYWICQTFPSFVKRVLIRRAARQAPHVNPKPHLTPRYGPWDQRVCASPDGDFFAALRSGQADIVTGEIAEVTATGEIQLWPSSNPSSRQVLTPDIIITATGLKLKFAGGIAFSIDGGEPIDASSKFNWKGTMLQDLPNVAFVLGYTNASWTLGADATMQLVVRLLGRMRQEGFSVATPRLSDAERLSMQKRPVFDLSSTYVRDADLIFPNSGTGQWKHKKNYFVDIYVARWGDITTGLEMR
ncbi:hypothetical protein BX600DRAFT_444134 [Xylariales sp. PMI_506]|nr:hypothetical protein BX600DRAFT_444134 [Xylariales sp. PMI_506]